MDFCQAVRGIMEETKTSPEEIEDRNSPRLCALRLGAARSAYVSGDLPEKAYNDIKKNGGKLPYPESVPFGTLGLYLGVDN